MASLSEMTPQTREQVIALLKELGVNTHYVSDEGIHFSPAMDGTNDAVFEWKSVARVSIEQAARVISTVPISDRKE